MKNNNNYIFLIILHFKVESSKPSENQELRSSSITSDGVQSKVIENNNTTISSPSSIWKSENENVSIVASNISTSAIDSKCIPSKPMYGRQYSNSTVDNVVTGHGFCDAINDSYHHPNCQENSNRNGFGIHSHESSKSISSDETTSSSSFSIPSHRRKLSINSYSTTKIPWCGCWGNGCL